ncbi:hypothetical protein, partial [Corallococcus soli]|uniref:hypothetical protein n=1 Tax=Corallococcus soli TaxID=2710757 RepID=UPI0039EE81CE
PSRGLPAWLTEALCLAALGVACLKLGQGVEAVLDLALWDEADYLHRAVMLPVNGPPDPEWGPLYSLWYFALSFLWPEPVALYYANGGLLLLLTSVAGYVLLRQLGARPGFALVGAAVHLLSMAPHVQPRPTLFALFVILVALCIACRARSREGAGACVGMGLLIASFARPEFFLSFLLMSGVLGVLLVLRARKGREHAREPRAWGTVGVYAGGVLVLVALLGNPFGNTSNRRFYAFCQHFADGHSKRTGTVKVDPWDQCKQVLQPVFGDADTLGAALRANPQAFLAHLRWNVERHPRESLRVLTSGYGGWPLLPGNGPWTREHAGHLLLVLVALGLPLAALLLRWRRLATLPRQPRVVETLVVVGVVLLPPLLSSVLLQPRHHYLVFQGVMGVAVLTALARAVEGPGFRDAAPSRRTGLLEPLLSALLATAVVLAVPDLVHRQGPASPPKREQLQRVRALQALARQAPIIPGEVLGVLDTQGGLPVYLGAPFQRVPVWTKRAGESFAEYLRRERIQVVFLDDRLRQEPRFANDPAVETFLARPDAFGHATWHLPGTDTRLAVPASWAGTGARATSPGAR